MDVHFTPSKFQTEIFESFRSSKENIVISAVAGSGKTKTLLGLLDHISPSKKGIFLAFNKSIATELSNQLPKGKNFEAINFHAIGARIILREYRGQVSIIPSKLFGLAKKCLPDVHTYVDPKKTDLYLFNLTKIVDLYRLNLLSDPEEMKTIIDNYGFEQMGHELQDAKKLLLEYREYNKTWRSRSKKFSIDFTDMLYLPVKRRYLKNDYDYVFVDEIQDLNAVQQEFVSGLLKPEGKFVGVGDKYQSIYGFLGADAQAYENMLSRPNTIELPLSYSYRCGKKIAEVANGVYPVIESPEDIYEGEVIETKEITGVNSKDFILCRNVKYLVDIYFKLIAQEIPCYIKGKEIGDELIAMVKMYKNFTRDQMIESVQASLKNLENRLKERGIKEKSIPYNRTYIMMEEKVQIIEIIASKYESVGSIIEAIERIFREVGEGAMLSTIHKSKGLESDTVFLYKPSLIPSRLASKPWQIIQERNLLYVAYTRAKKKLILVEP